jgi:hypothetical protein
LVLLAVGAGLAIAWPLVGSCAGPRGGSNGGSDSGVASKTARQAKFTDGAKSSKSTAPAKKPRYKTEPLRGRVVWLADALRQRYGVETDADAAHSQVALDADDGVLYPIVKDYRGRAFHLDERLRDVELELLVRRYEGSPLVQVVRVYTLKPDGKYELDYWCDACAIPMYELKECECCQGPVRIRERRVDEPPAHATEGAESTDATKGSPGPKETNRTKGTNP